MKRSWLLVLTLSLTLPASAAEPTPRWVVVAAPAFEKALAPLCAHRRAQGFEVVPVVTTDVLSEEEIVRGQAGKLRHRLDQLCRDHRGPCFVLLVGAVGPGTLTEPARKVVPTIPGTVGRMQGQPSDSGYGCPREGRLPTVAVGRFPARSAEEAEAMVAKTLALEKDARPGRWRRHLTILAGVPAYNPLVDRLVEGLAMARFGRVSPSWTGRAIYHNPSSRFCLPDEDLAARAVGYVEAGQAFVFYLGHSDPEGFYAGQARYMDRASWARLKIATGGCILVTFGCNGCQLAGFHGEGYGVYAVRNPHGPAAVLGAHGIIFAAMVQLACDGLFERCFTRALPDRLGTLWLAALGGVARGKIDLLTYKMLDSVDGDPGIPQEVQRQEHLEMLVLLGDPALRLPALPDAIELAGPQVVTPGQTLKVEGRLPAELANARVELSLERAVDSVPDGLAPLPPGDDLAALARRRAVLRANHEKANTFVLASLVCQAREGRIRASLAIPGKAPGTRLILRAYAATDSHEAQGVLALPIRPAASPGP